MQPLKGKKVLLGALAVLACGVDPTGNEGTPTAIRAQPEVVFVTQGDSAPVIVTVLDEDGQVLEADVTAGNVGTGIQVVEDPSYKQLQSENQIGRESRFFVKGVDLAASSFTLNALGLSKDIQVTSIPGALNATISNPTPALGDTITITAPAGTFFTDASVLSFVGAEPVVVSRDASTILFIPFPNIRAPAVVSEVGVTSNPALTFTLATPDTVSTDSIANVGSSLTPTNPALGDPVTLTLPEALRVIPESLVSLNIAGNEVPPLNVSVSPDSLTITFTPPPNADSFVVVPGVIARRLPMYPLEVPSEVKVVTPVVDSVPVTVSTTAPAVNDPVTLTITDPAFSFAPTAAVTVGASADPVVTSLAANSLSFVAPPGATGPISVDGVVIAGFSLLLPAKAPSITVGTTIPVLAGTSAPGTAPTLSVPTLTVDDATFTGADITPDGGVSAQYYQFSLAAETTLQVSVSSSDGVPDLDVLFCGDEACAVLNGFVASTAHDEVGEVTLPAGTHFMAVVNFDGAPTDFITMRLAP